MYPLQVENVFDKAFHTVGALLFHLFGHMIVYIQRKRRCRATQIPLDSLNIVSRLNGGGGIGVSQVTKPCLRYSHRLYNAFEILIYPKQKIKEHPRTRTRTHTPPYFGGAHLPGRDRSRQWQHASARSTPFTLNNSSPPPLWRRAKREPAVGRLPLCYLWPSNCVLSWDALAKCVSI